MCNNIKRTDICSSTVTGETYKINYYFNCDSKCLVCSITRRTCELQCTGQTCGAFWKRWNNYRSCTRKAEKDEEYKQKYLHKLFLQDDHHNAQVILIDKTSFRSLKTHYPYGLNIEKTY